MRKPPYISHVPPAIAVSPGNFKDRPVAKATTKTMVASLFKVKKLTERVGWVGMQQKNYKHIELDGWDSWDFTGISWRFYGNIYEMCWGFHGVLW